MDKNELLREAQNENQISGIYNLCDRWCEKCKYTSRCLTFTINQKRFRDGILSPAIPEFWEQIHSLLNATKELLDDYIRLHKIPMPTEKEQKEIDAQRSEVDRKIKSNHLVVESEKYFKDVVGFMKEQNHFLPKIEESDEESEEENSEQKTGLFDPRRDIIKEAIEIIIYYSPFMYVKIARTMHGIFDNEDKENDYMGDILVSSRLVVVAIERSMAAWHILFNEYKPQHENVIEFLLKLNDLKKGIEALIPEVKTYKRPYFD